MHTIEPIQIADVEAELSRLWDLRKEKNETKACLFNLIIYAQKKPCTEYLKKLIRSIAKKLPCRIIFIQGDSTAERNYLKVSVSNESMGKGNAVIVCDQILIETTTSQLSRVPSVILPNLIPDLPVYLLWGQDPTSDLEIFPYLQKFATRLIFDSGHIDNLQSFSSTMFSHINELTIELLDISWALIGSWRDALSHVFDTPETLHQLNYNQCIAISYNDAQAEHYPDNEKQAIYLLGWLAAQMKWTFVAQEKRMQERLLTYSNGSSHFVITISAKIDDAFAPGTILAVEIVSCEEQAFQIFNMGNLPKLTVYISSLEKCELPFTLPFPDLKHGLSLIKELFYYRMSTHYTHMLHAIKQIEWK